MAYLALYGNVGIPRAFCQECQRTAFVIEGIRQCCDKPTDECVEGSQRVSQPDRHKHMPPISKRTKILKRQEDRCLYCERRFGSSVWYKGKLTMLRLNWDHILPFEYARNNNSSNFVACCHVCNNWKSTRIFTHLEEIQVYVAEKWQRIETDTGKVLQGMQEHVPE